MKTLLMALIGSLVVSAEALAHFPFIVPDTDGGSEIRVVFNDSLKTDERVSSDRIAATTLFGINSTGQKFAIEWTKRPHDLVLDVPVKDVLVIGGFTDRGFVQSKHTDNKPVWIKHYPKAVLRDLAHAEKIRLDDSVPLELVPVSTDGGLRFLALWNDTPLSKAEVTVLTPDERKPQVTVTDAEGLTEASFEQHGRYGARVAIVEAAKGELQGKRYEEIRSYATLVVDFNSTNQ